MAKLTKFQRSQNAHNRLSKVGSSSNIKVCNYHSYVWNKQRSLGRVLTKQEKSSIYYDAVLRH